MEKIKTHITSTKLPYLDVAGVKYEVLSKDNDTTHIEIQMDIFTIPSIFYAGEKKGIDDMATWNNTQEF
jgi:hypothetical protein